jgi:hypothetical protein
MNTVFRSFAKQNWVLAGEHFALRVGSFAFSMVSANAILWFFNSLAMVQDSDPFQRYVPYVIAGGFGLLGYFVSRGLVYRMMRKEPIRIYIAIVLLFEFVEVVCNFAQAVSSVPHVQWLSRVQGGPHDVLSGLLYIAYSIVPVVTFVLAAVDMDLEKEKLNAASLRQSLASVPPLASRGTPVVPRATAVPTTTGRPVAAPSPVVANTTARPVVAPSPVMPQTAARPAPSPASTLVMPKGQGNGNGVDTGSAPSSGWRFPYKRTGGTGSQEGYATEVVVG